MIRLSGSLDPGRPPQRRIAGRFQRAGTKTQFGKRTRRFLVWSRRVQKLFDLDYNYRNWSWLLDPARLVVPPKVPRSLAPASGSFGQKGGGVPGEMSGVSCFAETVGAESRRHGGHLCWLRGSTFVGSEDAKHPSGDASPGLGIRPQRRPNQEGRLKRRGAPTSSRVAAHERVSGDYVIVSELRQVLVLVRQ